VSILESLGRETAQKYRTLPANPWAPAHAPTQPPTNTKQIQNLANALGENKVSILSISQLGVRMKKIDFHIHTVATMSDSAFNFDADKLRAYVETCELDAIAITNHNLFDVDQYRAIKSSLSISVFPGIEINLEGGHLLLIADADDISEFSAKCMDVTAKIGNPSDSISLSDLKSIFGNLGKYLLIPHYDKAPEVPDRCISELSDYISAGEVNSQKKFIYCLKNAESLVPVIFTDCRISSDLKSFSSRQTFINCGELTLTAIKSCLRDRTKVSLSKREDGSLFQIFENGQEISTGLTVVIGERSSGKSHTLRKIAESSINPKHIRQFSLVERDEKEDEEKFNKTLSQNQSLFTEEYLREYQYVVNDIMDLDVDADDKAIETYLASLKKQASEAEKLDAFSKAKLFQEELFQVSDSVELKKLISSVIHLIENLEFRSIIDKHIAAQNLKELAVELMKEYARREEERSKQLWLNDLMNDIKSKLRMRTATTEVYDVNFYKVAIGLERAEKFTELTKFLRRNRQIMQRDIQGFKVVAKIGEFLSAGEIKAYCRSRSGFKSAFDEYSDPYKYLNLLKEIDSLSKADFYKLFACVKYQILNKDGFEVSGGERSEFNLLQEISDAQKFDILLIDEPESSFDNIFLRNEVNKIIKAISQTMPIVLVTHNSTVGASINPDYILCTKKEIKDRAIEYRIYSGYPTDKSLKSTDGKVLKTSEVILGCLEAGKPAYNERRRTYESLEN
jgi:ABC-type dipeptide/oligopeptide/nickel transport system ATPase component